jgi:nucleoside triphosphate diphosphatase
MTPSSDIARLLEIMAALRAPGTGCPWDLEQTFETIAPYTIEEAYEVADAIERNDLLDLRDELGDLLLQVVFHAQMASERGAFAFGDVVLAITRKMIRRHPHVFGETAASDARTAKSSWEAIKAAEKAERRAKRQGAGQADPGTAGYLHDIPRGMSALMRALKLQQKAAKVGFDWGAPEPILDKIEEEIGELRQALESGEQTAVEDELGDVLFSVVNLCRHAGMDPEAALRGTNRKFADRFHHVETALRDRGAALERASLEEMEALWAEAKGAARK